MKGNLLVIDHKGTSGTLVKFLEKSGYQCFSARGPLKVRTILLEKEIYAIIWKENGGTPELVGDLLGEWRRHPDLPVIRLFSNTSTNEDFPRPNPVIESIPADAFETQLIPSLDGLFDTDGSESRGRKMQHTELAFRNLVLRLRRRWRKPAQGSAPVNHAEDFNSADTALNPIERVLLTVNSRMPDEPTSTIARLTHPLRKLFKTSR